jgi:hypothetical protein
MQWRRIILTAIALLVTTPSWALDRVSLQPKWKHQFQFGGYYAALEQGFYRDAGLSTSRFGRAGPIFLPLNH